MKHIIALILSVFLVACSNTVTQYHADGTKTEYDAETFEKIKRTEANKETVLATNQRIADQQKMVSEAVNKPIFVAECPPNGCVFNKLEVHQQASPEMIMAMNKHLPDMFRSIQTIKGETNWADAAVAVTDMLKGIGMELVGVSGEVLKANGGMYAMYKMGKMSAVALGNALQASLENPGSIDNSVVNTTTTTTTTTTSQDTAYQAGGHIADDGSVIREGSADISVGEDLKVGSENPVSTATTTDNSQHQSDSSDNSDNSVNNGEVVEEEVDPPA